MVAGLAGWACAPEERSVADVVAERTEALRAWGTTRTTVLANRERAEALLRAGRTDEAIAVLDAAEATRAMTRMLGIAHLRRGEEANCLTRGHAADVCIFPLRGVHADPEPARRAAILFSQLLNAEPDDLAPSFRLRVAGEVAGGLSG